MAVCLPTRQSFTSPWYLAFFLPNASSVQSFQETVSSLRASCLVTCRYHCNMCWELELPALFYHQLLVLHGWVEVQKLRVVCFGWRDTLSHCLQYLVMSQAEATIPQGLRAAAQNVLKRSLPEQKWQGGMSALHKSWKFTGLRRVSCTAWIRNVMTGALLDRYQSR